MRTNLTTKLFDKYKVKMDQIIKDKDGSSIYHAFRNGKNTYMRIDRLESSSYDISWIKTIEDCIMDLGDIIANPKETTKSASHIVPIELAKKTTAESVRHLASHTQFIKEVDEKGNVIPNKILNIVNEEEIHTYENRFIATLVRKLVLFIEKRYEFVKNFAHLHDEEILYFKNKSNIDGAEVEVETKIKVKSLSETQEANLSNKYFDRIQEIRNYVLYFYESPFMKALKTDKNVKSPVILTNILRKNIKYHHCYELYRFIERYDQLGVSYNVNETVKDFTEKDMDDISKVLVTNYLALKAKDKHRVIKETEKVYKPKILTSLDDEPFIYGNLVRGPIEFLRVDQAYLDYIEQKNTVVVPEKPTKEEKQYYKEDVEEKKRLKQERAQIEKLERRKRKEAADFEKKAKQIVAIREKEEEEERARQEAIKRDEENKKVENIRQKLINAALSQKEENESLFEQSKLEEQAKEELEPSNEEVVTEEAPTEEEPLEFNEAPEEINEEPLVEEEEPVEDSSKEELSEENKEE